MLQIQFQNRHDPQPARSPRVVTSIAGFAIRCLIISIFCLSALQAGLVIVNNSHSPAGVIEAKYLIMSLISMGIAGLGLMGLLLFSQILLERALSQKDRAIMQLEPRIVAMEAAMDGIAIIGADDNIIYINKMLAGLYGRSKADMIGKPWAMMYSESQVDWLREEVFPHVEQERHWIGQAMGQQSDGTIFFQDMSITRLRDGGKIFIVRDFTEARRMAELSSKRLAAMEAAGDGIGIVDAEGRLTYVNGALMRLHGLSALDLSDYIGRPWINLYSDKGKKDIISEVNPILDRDGYWKGEAPIVRKDGSIAYAEMSLTKLPDGGMIGTARDITEQRAARAEKENLQRQFFQAQKMEAIGRLAGGIAHDFNNILASVMGYTGFLLEDLPDEGQARGFAHHIMQGCQQARNLVDQILTFSRTREDVRQTMDLSAAVQDTINMLRSTLPVSIELKSDMPDESIHIRANPVQISQALMNLCVNARDAMPDEQGRLSICLDIIAGSETAYHEMLADIMPETGKTPDMKIFSKDDQTTYLMLGKILRAEHYARLRIVDDGCGISRDVMEHMFEPFYTTKPMDLGTGLGLSAVHGIVAGHQGALLVESRESAGTEFFLYFPLDKAAIVQEAAGSDHAAKIGTGNILLVEDQPDVQEMLKLMLERLGYNVGICHSGDEAIDHLREQPGRYDLVLSDQSMPRMSGTEMAAQIRDDFPMLPVILITGYSRERLKAAQEDNESIKAILPKPVDSNTLSHVVQDTIGKSRSAAAA